jgi:hypothetical protein
MNYVTVDEILVERLRGLVEPVEIRDAGGKTLGQYVPAVSPELSAQYQKARALFDLEEAQRLVATETKGYTFDEVNQHLNYLSLELGGPLRPERHGFPH